MRLTAALAIPLLLTLAACGGGRPKGVVTFTGPAPATAAQKAKDARGIVVTCPGPCANRDGSKSPISYGIDKCPVKNCIEKLGWDKSYPCPSCRTTGECSACMLFERTDGKCFNCAGAGTKTYAGKSPECSNCKGKDNGACPICAGSKKCDYCKGAGHLDDATVQGLAAKNAPKAAEDEGGK